MLIILSYDITVYIILKYVKLFLKSLKNYMSKCIIGTKKLDSNFEIQNSKQIERESISSLLKKKKKEYTFNLSPNN